MLKRFLSLFLLTILFLGFVGVVKATEPRTVRVGTYDSKPKIYKDADGDTKGVFADVINYIAVKENWNVEYDYGLWEEGLEKLKKGEIDIMVDVAFSEERALLYDFTEETVLNSWGEVYVQKNSDIDSVLDLDGKKIAILKSSIYEEGKEGIGDYLKAFGISATLMEVDENVNVLYLVESGAVDAGIVSHIFGITHKNDYVDLKLTKIFLKPTELKFALTKNDSDNDYFIEKLDYWVNSLKDGDEDYFYKSLENNGLTGAIPTNSYLQDKIVLPYWVLPAVLGTVAGFLLYAGSDKFKKQIRNKKKKQIKDKMLVQKKLIK